MKVSLEYPTRTGVHPKHLKFPSLWDATGRPIMAVAKVDAFLECQEAFKKPNDPKTWYNMAMQAAQRCFRPSEPVEESVKYMTIAVHCLNKSNRLKAEHDQEALEALGDAVCLAVGAIVAWAWLIGFGG